ncbi:hypothetical protein OO256_01175 [Pseudomonas sp. DCB_CB]|uniref:hypothetical protein n=1 Tax=unclassified Pseudomonas TaxID=196821 RepID=UPI0022496C1F|nr:MULTISPECIES: hypothetical protein [unclassified Pseudomonas]MCX2689630.1 hypothetical protein [Pseudomonas sp. DCB_BZ]MCX2854717.1 hypothetical protein [Pseudomonas sp. DCB_CB]
MFTIYDLPKNYKAYGQLEVCSNTLKGGGVLAVVGDVPPLLFGRGERPMVWLQAPTDFTGKNFITLVEASVSSHPSVNVVALGHEVKVFVANDEILSIVQMDNNQAKIDHLDLRPIGFNIVGDEEGLQIGGASFATSTFSGIGSLVSLTMTP